MLLARAVNSLFLHGIPLVRPQGQLRRAASHQRTAMRQRDREQESSSKEKGEHERERERLDNEETNEKEACTTLVGSRASSSRSHTSTASSSCLNREGNPDEDMLRAHRKQHHNHAKGRQEAGTQSTKKGKAFFPEQSRIPFFSRISPVLFHPT